MTPNAYDLKYHRLVQKILDYGETHENRTGVDTLSLFGEHLQLDIRHEFPLLTTKKLHTKSIFVELLWFLRGDTNTKYLHEHDVTIWDEWADENGDLGPVYGEQWRSWLAAPQSPNHPNRFHDQIATLLRDLKHNPNSRRHIVSAWNVGELAHMALPPCHLLWQVKVHADDSLSLQMYQRSADLGLGVPFNVASYATLLHILGWMTKRPVSTLSICFGDVHIYKNHIHQLEEQISREPRQPPRLRIHNRGQEEIDDWQFEDFEVLEYDPHPHIPMPVAV